MKYKFLVLFALITCMSCSLETEYGLPQGQKIDMNLIGVWSNNQNDKIVLKRNNDYQYILEIADQEFIGYINTVNGHNIFTIIEEKEDKTLYTFYAYELTKNEIQLYAVNEDFKNDAFASDAEVLNFFEANLNHPDFLEDLFRIKNLSM